MTEDEIQQDKLHIALRQLMELSSENAKLRAENAALKNMLFKEQHESLPIKQAETVAPILPHKKKLIEETTSMSKAQKIVLFRSLFRGREDVYPTRWDNPRSGKSGYSPAIKNKWEYFEAKKQGDKTVIPEYLALTDEVIQQHLEGKIVAGVYPLLNDDACWFLAVDFDEASFEDDALSFVATCKELGISAYIERSRSCNGAHVWTFFKEPLPAALARQLGFSILTRTMEK